MCVCGLTSRLVWFNMITNDISDGRLLLAPTAHIFQHLFMKLLACFP